MFACQNAYTSCEIHPDGSVYPCCRDWCGAYSFGNILEEDFEKIWFGERAQNFRNQFFEQKYTYCDLGKCFFNKVDVNSHIVEDIKFPKEIRIVYDRCCNLQCIFCRPDFIVKPDEQVEKINEVVKGLLPKFNEERGVFYLNGSGEVFSSPFLQDFIKEIIENYPNIRFHIITNGMLASKEKIESLKLEDRIDSIEISLHSTTEKTYNKLVKGGNFQRLMENVEYLSSLYRNCKVKTLYLNYTVTAENFHEMKSFIKYARRLGAIVNFLPLGRRQGVSDELFDRLNISNPKHPKYPEFYKVMKDPAFRVYGVHISKDYLNLEKPQNRFLKFLSSCCNRIFKF